LKQSQQELLSFFNNFVVLNLMPCAWWKR